MNFRVCQFRKTQQGCQGNLSGSVSEVEGYWCSETTDSYPKGHFSLVLFNLLSTGGKRNKQQVDEQIIAQVRESGFQGNCLNKGHENAYPTQKRFASALCSIGC